MALAALQKDMTSLDCSEYKMRLPQAFLYKAFLSMQPNLPEDLKSAAISFRQRPISKVSTAPPSFFFLVWLETAYTALIELYYLELHSKKSCCREASAMTESVRRANIQYRNRARRERPFFRFQPLSPLVLTIWNHVIWEERTNECCLHLCKLSGWRKCSLCCGWALWFKRHAHGVCSVYRCKGILPMFGRTVTKDPFRLCL